ncbi:MAG: aminotransferase class I/II-fold pyridoxal phosphate-dependent enzyme [Lachnospiraceae bacterium]|nr:aminotransferase class I/II-fold pyridoxal phosphate-dependent enzyme [Lachnospiraceae bacterium]
MDKNMIDIKNQKKYIIDMNRGWPCKEQLDLSMPMLDCVTASEIFDIENDYRSYSGTGGIPEARKLFAALLDVEEDEIYIGGTMSTTIMYDIISEFMFWGWNHVSDAWSEHLPVRFLCPSPGYEKHFLICERFGIEMISVPIYSDGPDIELIEALVRKDKSIRGIWCVPKYSNPTGSIYSQEVVYRLVQLCVSHPNFNIFWDNAYCVHDLTEQRITIPNILKVAKESGVENNIFMFASTSKITFPGGGIATLASSKNNIAYYISRRNLALKTGDKINQLRHVRFLKNVENIYRHMSEHRRILLPKFQLVNIILNDNFSNNEFIHWQIPKGGYFMLLQLYPHTAKKIYEKCKQKGVLLTQPNSIYPNRNDPADQFIRLAPTHPSLNELDHAITILSAEIKSCS